MSQETCFMDFMSQFKGVYRLSIFKISKANGILVTVIIAVANIVVS